MTEYFFSAVNYQECKSEYIEFRNENRASSRDEAYFEWRFLKKPGGSSPLVIWATASSGKKIGCVGFTQDVYMANGKPVIFGQLSDISISSQWRGKGIAKKMLDFLAEQPDFRAKKASFAMPNKDAARALEKSGWTTLSSIERYVKICRTGPKIKKVLGRNPLSSSIAGILDLALKFSSRETFHVDKKIYAAGLVERFDARFDAFWEKYDKNDSVLGLRTSEYLSWRYSLHPLVDYKTFALLEGDSLLGYAVYYIDNDQCHVEDVISLGTPVHSRLLFSYFIRFINNNYNTCAITIRINRNEVCPLPLRQFGFLRRNDGQRFMVRPGAGEALPDSRRWFLTSGDKDA